MRREAFFEHRHLAGEKKLPRSSVASRAEPVAQPCDVSNSYRFFAIYTLDV